MAFTCKNLCGVKQEVEWQYINNAWLPVISVCSSRYNVPIGRTCVVAAADTTCNIFNSSLYLWDACFTDSLTKSEESVTAWFDRNQNFELYPVDTGKEPGFTISTNNSKNFNMLTFNGVNQGVVGFYENITAFTSIVVVNNLGENVPESTGAILAISSNPIEEQLVLGFDSGNIVVRRDDQMGGLTDMVNPIACNNGFNVIAIRYTGENVELFVNGGTASRNEDPYVFFAEAEALDFGSSFGDYPLLGEIGWIAYYDSAVSDYELNRAISFAGRSFGITTTTIA